MSYWKVKKSPIKLVRIRIRSTISRIHKTGLSNYILWHSVQYKALSTRYLQGSTCVLWIRIQKIWNIGTLNFLLQNKPTGIIYKIIWKKIKTLHIYKT
jgi:hypothetical protein